MHLGPDRLIVGARVDLSDDVTSAEVELLPDDQDVRLTNRLTMSPHVFLDPTRRRGGPLAPEGTDS